MKTKRLKFNISDMDETEIRELVLEIINNHPRKGAMNIINAGPNADLKSYIIRMTSFLDDYKFVNFSTRCYVFAKNIKLDDIPHCGKCGKLIEKNVVSVHAGFKYVYCSYSCCARSDKTKDKKRKTNVLKHGDPNWNNRRQAEKTCMRHFGVKYGTQNEKVVKKVGDTKMKKYGSRTYVNPEKATATKLKLYGMKQNGPQISKSKLLAAKDPAYNRRQLEMRQRTNLKNGNPANWNNHEQISETKLKRYGDPNWNNYEQISETKLKRYGDPNWNNGEKYRKTCIDRYGVSNYAKTNECREKRESSCIDRFGVRNFSQCEEGRTKMSENRNRMFFEKMLSDKNKTRPMFTFDDYMEKTGDTVFEWKCAECGSEFSAPVNFVFARQTGNFARCLTCHPVTFCNSRKQEDVYDFIISVAGRDAAVKNDRKTIPPKEIDILLKNEKIGFEFDGIFWHSAYWNSDTRHLSEKTLECAEAGVKLYHIFEDEWDMRTEQMKDRIVRLIRGNDMPCENMKISTVPDTAASGFFNENSADMFVKRATYNRGLTDKTGTLCSVISFNLNNRKMIITGFQDKIGFHFKNSLRVLIDSIVKEFAGKIESVVMKIDARWPDIGIFCDTKFEIVKTTNPSIWLVSSAWKRVLKNVNKNTAAEYLDTEFGDKPLIDSLHELKYTVIPDCGNMVFQMDADLQAGEFSP